MINKVDLQWIAGIIDAEGSIGLYYKKKKVNGYIIKSRKAILRISTCDHIIIPEISRILNKKYIQKRINKNRIKYIITLTGNKLKYLLSNLVKFLYTKQPHALFCLKAIYIKNGKNEFYSENESNAWENYRKELKELNERGRNATVDNKDRSHIFTWPWLAGLIDGDGSITLSEFGPRHKPSIKPIIKISLAHLKTIIYLCEKFNRTELKGGKIRGNRRLLKTIRFMSTDIYNLSPKIIPHLRLKKKLAELAYQIVSLRKEVTNKANPIVNELLGQFRSSKIDLSIIRI